MMKKGLLLPFYLLPIALSAQQGNFKISGKLSTAQAGEKVYLSYRLANGTNVADSVELKNGAFEFSGQVNEPTKALISSGLTARSAQSTSAKSIYLGQEQIKIMGTASIKDAKVEGGKINAENQKLEAALTPINKQMELLNTKFRAIKEDQPDRDQLIQNLREEASKLSDQTKIEQEKFIKENPGSLISLELANSLISYPPDAQTMEGHFNGLTPEIKNSPAGKRFAESISKVKAVQIGMIAPDFTQNDPDGKPISLSDFRGKYVLIDFWASWCGPCRQENPNLVKAFHQFKDKNFTVLGVSLDNPGKKEAWLKAIADDQLDWPQVSDLQGWNNVVAKQYYIRSIPQNLLIDPSGKIVAKNLRGEDLAPALEKLLN